MGRADMDYVPEAGGGFGVDGRMVPRGEATELRLKTAKVLQDR